MRCVAERNSAKVRGIAGDYFGRLDAMEALDGQLQDMAADLGLTREAFYRTVAALEAEGVMARTEQAVVIRKSP